jgi:NTP pyrophosphatase (non-canonical NTP hydrolase)
MNTLESVWNEGEANHAEYSTMDNNDADIRFLALALCGEAGELANFIKKEWRDGKDYSEEIAYEIADVALYTIMLAAKCGLTPQDLLNLMAFKQQKFRKKMKALGGHERS